MEKGSPILSRRERRARTTAPAVKATRSALAIHAIGDAAGNAAVICDGVASWLWGPASGVISGRAFFLLFRLDLTMSLGHLR